MGPLLFPGLVQTLRYHGGPGREAASDPTDEWMEVGWEFKSERGENLRDRTDEPTVNPLLGEPAFLMLSKGPETLQIEQLDHLTAHDELPGWEIRVLTEPWFNNLGAFGFHGPGDPSRFPDAGPPIIHNEVLGPS